MKTSVIVGSAGQDGTLLGRLLSQRGHRVIGIDRGDSTDITSAESVARLVAEYKPDEVYYLAAVHHSSEESQGDALKLARQSYEINVFGLLNFLEAIRTHAKSSRLFYASSSHVFGEPSETPQRETTPFQPLSEYAVTKTAGMAHCRAYRHRGVFASCGILYNHESELRASKFVTTKIIEAAVAIQRGSSEKLVLGNLDARVDWSAARDTVEAMSLILSHREPDDFIIASGVARSVRDFVSVAFGLLGLPWEKHVEQKSDTLMRQLPALVGDSSRLKRATQWTPRLTFETMIRDLLVAKGGKLA